MPKKPPPGPTNDRLPVAAGADVIVPSKYGGVEITVDGEDFVIMPVRDVLAAAASGHAAIAADAGADPSPAALRVRRFLEAIGLVQADEADAARPAILKAMVHADIDPVPSATVAQAHRLARQRDRLVASGAFTVEALRELRGDAKASTTRTWLARRRAAGQLFTVAHDGGILVPAFQLDHEGTPLSAIKPVLAELASAELGGWATWTWFTSATPWLSGAAPVDLLGSDADRVVRAARRFATTAA